MKCLLGLLTVALALPASGSVVGGSLDDDKGHHHHHKGHHKHHHKLGHKHDKAPEENATVVATQPDAVVKSAVQSDSIVDKMKKLEAELAKKAEVQATQTAKGHILVNGPLPADFNERFAQAVGHATGADPNLVKVTATAGLEGNPGIVEVSFEAPRKVVKAVENDAADPESKLAKGNLRPFLIAQNTEDAQAAATYHSDKESPPGLAPKGASEDQKAEHLEVNQVQAKKVEAPEEKEEEQEEAPTDSVPVHHVVPHEEATPVEEKGLDIDTQMPYGDLEPFGREDTAQELTESSVKESDAMVDQLERAEVAEEKRSVFRALTRLRGAAITSFDGVARSQTGNIDEYNKVHKWRKTHPLHHLADEESDVSKWAFPDNADFIQVGHNAK